METYIKETFKINSLKELLILGEGEQLSAQEIINKRVRIGGRWTEVEFTIEFYNNVIPLIVGVIGGQKKSKERIESALRFSKPQHWALGRIFFTEYKNKVGVKSIYCSYCAGQDGQFELSLLRKYLLK